MRLELPSRGGGCPREVQPYMTGGCPREVQPYMTGGGPREVQPYITVQPTSSLTINRWAVREDFWGNVNRLPYQRAPCLY